MKRVGLLWFLCLALPAWAQGTLEVIQLRSRSAAEVIPVLQPLLAPGGALSGQGYQLFVRTTPENLEQLRSALAAMDRPQRRLIISVRFDNSADAARSSAGGGVVITNRGAAASGHISETRSSGGERVDQQIQVLDGGQARISTGEARRYSETATGMIVVPRVAGDTVSLEVYAQQEAYGQGGTIRGQSASSVVSGRLGEWIELGGTSTQSMRSDSGIASARSRSSAEDRRILLKVEEIR